MAKQGINPIEQHVEKIVLGVSALLFAFVVFSYVVSTPITVAVKGQTISPYDLDRQLGEIADEIARLYKGASFVQPTIDPNAPGGTAKALDDLRKSLGLLDNMPTSMLAPVTWWPEYQKPEGKDIGSGGAHDLASVSAPVIKDLSTGVTSAVLAAQVVDPLADPTGLAPVLQAYQPRATATAGLSGQDVTWAFLKLNFDMQQQYEIFRQNGYSREQANIILFMDVQVQRQRVRPDGSAGPWEDVSPYKTVSFQSAPATIAVSPEGLLGQLDDQRIRQLFAGLSSAQVPLLYPLPQVAGGDPFPPHLADGVQKLLATDANLAAIRPAAAFRSPTRTAMPRAAAARGGGRSSGGRGGDRGGDRGGGRGEDPHRSSGGAARGPSPAQARSLDPAAMQAMTKAEQALKQKRYTEAMQFLDQARQGGAAQNARYIKLDTDITAAYTAWQQAEAGRQQLALDEGARNAEIWVYDFQAQPGKTYCYRTRVVLFNVFSHPDIDRNELKNPQDGAQVALTGVWSEPSLPVTIASPLQFFLAGTGTAGDTSAAIEIFRFQQGQWYSTRVQAGPGEPIGDLKPKTTKTPELDFRTSYTVVDIGLDPRAVVETDTGGDAVKVSPKSCLAMVYMDDDGSIQQRWSARDSRCQLRKELEFKVKLAADQPAPPAATALPMR